MQTQSESTESSPTPSSSRSATQPRLDETRVGVQPGLLGTFDHLAEQRELREQFEQLRAERDRLLERQRQIAELLHSQNLDKIVHDLRNVLHELQLYKMLAEAQLKKQQQ